MIVGRLLTVLAALVVSVVIAGCATAPLPLKEKTTNAHMGDIATIRSKLDVIPTGSTQKAVFDTLQVQLDGKNVEIFSRLELNRYLYNGFQVSGGAIEAESFRKVLDECVGFRIPVVRVIQTGWLTNGFTGLATIRQGIDTRIILLFCKNQLFYKGIEGVPTIEEYQKRYVWDLVFEGAQSGIKEAVSDVVND